MVDKCKNCKLKLNQGSNFCTNCGQKIIDQRLTVKIILNQIFLIITNLEQGLWFTLKEMFVAPERVISSYINGRTKPYTPPFKFIFLLATVSIIVSLATDIYDLQQEKIINLLNINDAKSKYVISLVRPYLNLIYMLIIPFMSLLSWGLFKKKKLNYAEHLVSNAYLFGLSTTIGTGSLLLIFIFPSFIDISALIGTLISIFCISYGNKRLFKITHVEAFLKAVLIVILGYLLLIVFTMISTILIISIIFLGKQVLLFFS